MILTKLIRENAEAISQVGVRALEEAKHAGVPAYYMDPSLGDGIIRELPDGTRERVERRNGWDVVTETYGPRLYGSARPPPRRRASARRCVQGCRLRLVRPVVEPVLA